VFITVHTILTEFIPNIRLKVVLKGQLFFLFHRVGQRLIHALFLSQEKHNLKPIHTMKTEATLIENKTKDIVLFLLDAINKEDFKKARTLVTDDFKFNGVLGSRNGADDYFKSMEQLKFKFEIKKIFSDGKDACVLYDVTMSGKKIFCCGWYHLREDKISSLRVVFDPRPVLEASERKQ
jgi:hypothetical protein